jgi:zinc protease
VDKERGVIVEEWRSRRNAGARIQDAQFPVLLKGSRYADRLPIGTTDSIQHFKIERLKDFYTTWYRPDLMAIVAVGDFDVKTIEGLVRKHFGSIPASKAPKPRPTFDVPAQPGTQYGIATDKEAQGATVSIYVKATPQRMATVGDYRREITTRLAAAMLSTRLGEAAQRPGSPLLGATAARARIVRSTDATIVTGALRQDSVDRGLVSLFTEAERVTRFGFTQPELERQKTNTQRGMERAVAEKDTRPSAQLAAEYIRNFTVQEPFPGLTVEDDLTRRFLPEITLDQINAIAKTWMPDVNRVVLLYGPAAAGSALPDAGRLAAMIKNAESATIAPYVARTENQPLLDTAPPRGSILKTSTRASFGLTEWELSNGAKVVLKPTTFKEDEIVFTAVSPGGTSLASDADFIPAATAAQVVSSMGIGKFASGDLRRVLTGKVAAVRPVIGLYQQGLAGGGSRQDLETLFQLIYLYFTQPRRDPVIFAALTSQIRSGLANQAATPEFAFAAALNSAVTQDHPRSRLTTRETVDAMNVDTSLAFYKERFADASAFTFVFVGSFDPEAMKPLVEQYLAGLPATHRPAEWKDVGIRAPAGVVERRVEKGTEPKSRTAIVFTGPMENDLAKGIAYQAMGDVLQTRLRDTLREALGGTYNVTVSPGITRRPRDEYNLGILFEADPARMDSLATRVFDEIARLKASGPTAKEVANAKTALLRDYETNIRRNAFLLTQIGQRYELGEEPESLLQVPGAISQVSGASIHEAAKSALDVNRYVKVMLFPAK